MNTQKKLQKSIKSLDPELDEQIAFAADVKALSKTGTFVGPHIVTGIDPESNLAQEEHFGPILMVFRARNLDEAFTIANNTRFALTGGIYSRNPKSLKRARNEFHVGNLYLNREITDSFVQRQPFGGFGMSGLGTKAGGPDYLLQFLVPINVTENTMRRGYDPKAVKEPAEA